VKYQTLNKVDSPRDIKKMDISELRMLCDDIREQIIEVVSKGGGHLASSLGVVELTVALHYVLDTPKDKIVWDVGHQCYAHKLITGRRESFHTIRRPGGLSGFPKRSESPYDNFGTGHSSTSISAALGMASARDIKGEDFSVIAVIGDGSLTGGMAFEALNHLGHTGRNMIIILNDNEMSIARNVGAVSRYLNQIITGKLYNNAKKDIESLLGKVPSVGTDLVKFSHKVESSIKGLIIPGRLFENFGIRYLGPFDGHNLEKTIAYLQHVKLFRGPVLMHMITKKGKGYRHSEEHPEQFHSAPAFEVETGVSKSGGVSYTKIFSDGLVELGRSNPNIAAITAAMPMGTGLDVFAEEFPERFYDVGIAEQHAVTLAAGLACEGIKPVVAIYSTFLQRALDQIIHDVALQKLNVVFALDRAGIVGADGPTHHGLFDLSYMRQVPHMVVMVPRDEIMLRRMLITAAKYSEGPISLRYPRAKGQGLPMPETLKSVKIGTAETLVEGRDACILAVGTMIEPAVKASEILKKKGISLEVIDMRFVKPLDEACLRDVAGRFKIIATMEENTVRGGFGSGVMEALIEMNLLPGYLGIWGLPDDFVPQGDRQEIMAGLELDAKGVARRITTVLRPDSEDSYLPGRSANERERTSG